MLKKSYCNFQRHLMFWKNISVIFLIVMLCSLVPAIYADAGSGPEIPKFPMIHLVYNDKVYEGLPGSSCWPTHAIQDGKFATLCHDGMFVMPSEIIPVSKGDSIVVEIAASEAPSRIRASLFAVDDISDTGETTAPAKLITELNAAFMAPWTIDLPAGVYMAVIEGFWSSGDMSRVFNMTVLAKED